MMKNKKVFAVCLFVFQILIIAGLVIYSALFSFVLDKFGKEYKIDAEPHMYVSDGVCHFDVETMFYAESKVYIVPSEKDGLYELSGDYYGSENAVNYIYSRNRDDFFPATTEYRLKNAELFDWYYSFDEENAYVTVKVFMGKAAVTGVYCDGVPIEEYVKTLSTF